MAKNEMPIYNSIWVPYPSSTHYTGMDKNEMSIYIWITHPSDTHYPFRSNYQFD